MKTGWAFVKEPSKAYLKALIALNDLLEGEGFDTVTRVYAEAVHQAAQKQFSAGKLERRSGAHVCYHRLQGAKRCPDSPVNPCYSRFPAGDHVSEWVKDGKTEVIVSQPYGLSFKDLKEIVEYCEENGLEAEIQTNTSWHFPGRTLLLKYTKA